MFSEASPAWEKVKGQRSHMWPSCLGVSIPVADTLNKRKANILRGRWIAGDSHTYPLNVNMHQYILNTSFILIYSIFRSQNVISANPFIFFRLCWLIFSSFFLITMLHFLLIFVLFWIERWNFDLCLLRLIAAF